MLNVVILCSLPCCSLHSFSVQWARLNDETKKPGAIKEWQAFELAFEEEARGGHPHAPSRPAGPQATARSDPRRLQHYIHQELTTYFENVRLVSNYSLLHSLSL